jgi:hypothetical protein
MYLDYMLYSNNLARLYGEIYFVDIFNCIYPAYVWGGGGAYSMLDDIIGNGMQDCIDGMFVAGLSFRD